MMESILSNQLWYIVWFLSIIILAGISFALGRKHKWLIVLGALSAVMAWILFDYHANQSIVKLGSIDPVLNSVLISIPMMGAILLFMLQVYWIFGNTEDNSGR